MVSSRRPSFLDSGGLIAHARRDPNIPEGEIYKFVVERKPPKPPRSWVIFYIADLYSRLTEELILRSRRLNGVLRWI